MAPIAPGPLKDGQRVLIIRPSAIGDIVMASPLLHCLRQTWPRLYIAWLVEPPAQALLQSHPALNALLPWPKAEWKKWARTGQWLRLQRHLREFSSELRAQHFDLAIDAQGLFRSRAMAWLSGARLRIGFASREPGRWLMTRVIDRGPRTRCMGSEYRHLAGMLGARCEDFHPRLFIAPPDRQAGADWVRRAGIDGDYAVFCPFTTRPQKHWIAPRWAALASGLRERLALPVILLGGPSDQQAARQLQAISAVPLVDLTGRTSLAEAAAVVAGSRLVVGVDTGLTHMASAFRRPCLALFGATCPYLTTESPLTVVLYHALPCSPCRRRPTCNGRYDCMAALTAARVLDQAELLLQESGKAHAHPAP